MEVSSIAILKKEFDITKIEESGKIVLNDDFEDYVEKLEVIKSAIADIETALKGKIQMQFEKMGEFKKFEGKKVKVLKTVRRTLKATDEALSKYGKVKITRTLDTEAVKEYRDVLKSLPEGVTEEENTYISYKLLGE